MLLLADGARLFEPTRDAAIEFIFTRDKQVIAVASWIARRTSDISRLVAACRLIRRFYRLPRLFSGAAQSAICSPRSAVLRPLTSDLCSLSYSHSIVLGGLLEMS